MRIIKILLYLIYLFFVIYPIIFSFDKNTLLLFKVFMSLRSDTFYNILDKQIIDFVTSQNVNLVINLFTLLLEIFILYCIIFYINLLLSVLNRNFRSTLDRSITEITNFFLSTVVNFKQNNTLKLIAFIIPFFNLFMLNINFFHLTTIFNILTISSIMYGILSYTKEILKLTNTKNVSLIFTINTQNNFFYKWIFYNLLLAFIMFFLFFTPLFIKYNQDDVHILLYIKWFTQMYSLSAFLLVLISIIKLIIQFEFNQAKKNKENIKNINFELYKFKTRDKAIQYIDSEVSKILSTPKCEWMVKRGNIIENRNRFNLDISLYIVLVLLFITLITIIKYDSSMKDPLYFLIKLEDSNAKVLILSIILLSSRLFSRSFEILKGFLDDALSSTNKQSNLSGNKRIKLMLFSLIEVVILSFGLKTLYIIFVNTENAIPSLFYLKEGVVNFFNTWAVQLFNVSFDEKLSFFLATIHIIQISVAACLILLSLSVYSGKNDKNIIFELIRKDNGLLLKETLVIGEERYERIIKQGLKIENVNATWNADLINTEQFKEFQICYKELLANEKNCEEQKNYILESYDNYQKLSASWIKFKIFFSKNELGIWVSILLLILLFSLVSYTINRFQP
ncbi:hypothetical protein ABFY48_06905 [Lysinibacillus pakistanensis]|uniref:hypothetical protein n=1 Tax=Lysinibacillus pakistanensis TaxID=759811 RepID=UPI003D28DA52